MLAYRPRYPRPIALLRDTWRDFRREPATWLGFSLFMLGMLTVNQVVRFAERVMAVGRGAADWLKTRAPWVLVVEGLTFDEKDLPDNFRNAVPRYEDPDRRVWMTPDPVAFNVWRALHTVWIPRTGTYQGEVEVTWKSSTTLDGVLRLTGEMVQVRKPGDAPVPVVLYPSCALVGREMVRVEDENIVSTLWRNARQARAYLLGAGAPVPWSLDVDDLRADEATEEEILVVDESDATVTVPATAGGYLN